jgi:cell volume regulation protein A
MAFEEPLATGWMAAVAGLLLLASVLFSRPSERIGFPAVLLFLGLGLGAGLALPGQFDDFSLAFRIGVVALVLILFDGGLNTPWKSAREQLAPAAVLASAGVLLTAAVVALGARLLGLEWREAALVGAIVSSTDAAAVFAALRGSNVALRRRVGTTLELESGLNDPIAVLLTVTLTGLMLDAGGVGPGAIALSAALQLGVGLAAGLAVGWLGRQLLARVRVPAGGLYPVLTLALALLAFGAPTVFMGSGFLAVYVAALLLSRRRLPYQAGILRVHDALAWLGQITMFLVLGLLAIPGLLAEYGFHGIVLALALALVARPIAVALCLAPFGFTGRETAFIAWTGLRGAVPILLASYPVMMGVDGALGLFHLVFFIVAFNALIPGATVRWAVSRLGVDRAGRDRPPPVLEINTTEVLPVRILSFYIDPAAMVTGSRAGDLPLPAGADILMLVRDGRIMPVREDTVLQAGDHAHLLIEPGQSAAVELLFGLREDG